MKKIITILLIVFVATAFVVHFNYNHTDIPKLYLDGDITSMVSKSETSDISFHYVNGKQDIVGFAEIKYQGTSSMGYDKKNYTLKFFSDVGHKDKLQIDVGWGPQNKYCMKANWIDRTHARNVVSAKLVAQMQKKYGLFTEAPNNGAIDGFPVEIYNNGKFHGLYTFNIPKDEWLFAMDSDNPNHIVICGEGWDDANLFKAMPDFDTWAVEVGEESEYTQQKMDRLFDFIINSTDEQFKDDIGQYLNLDSVLNYYVFTDLAYLKDNCGKNMLIATYDGYVWFLSLYDLDTSWGTNYTGRELWQYKDSLVNLSRNRLFERIETCFPKELANRYFELRESILSNGNIMAEFRTFKDQIPVMTFVKETLRWGQGIIKSPGDIPGYDYGQIEEYLHAVQERLDAKYQAMLN